MEPLTLVLVIAGVIVLAIFNYYLNLAPGSDPDDFALGPPQLNLTCDCYLNTMILGGIMVIAFSAGSTLFDSRIELYFFGGLAFATVTVAGIVGRRKRHAEWKEDEQVIRRAIQKSPFGQAGRSLVDTTYNDEEEDDELGYEDY
ncbi:hypothetical protein E4H12_03445 [Candidatus Thorarchaeota archaeon]|nr:MAG: hypothetical protein E4H12_03445 [Candidatus Thorarchaeota archaeon]